MSAMAEYDYKCAKCGKKFTITMSITDYGRKRVKCPKCASAKINRILAPFFTQTSKKS